MRQISAYARETAPTVTATRLNRSPRASAGTEAGASVPQERGRKSNARQAPPMKTLASLVVLLSFFFGTAISSNAMDIDASVLTQHNDNRRTGANLHESDLTPSSIVRPAFGRIAQFDLDGVISAQPLFVAGDADFRLGRSSTIDSVYVATNNNTIYRISHVRGSPKWEAKILWHLPGSATTLPGMLPDPRLTPGPAKPCNQTRWPVGIVSTPVIDGQTNVMYFVYRSGTEYPNQQTPWPNIIDAHWYLAAIDIRDGHPVRTSKEVAAPNFSAQMQLNRPGLLLEKGNIYVAFGAAVCDSGGNPNLSVGQKPAWHGWVFAYDAKTFARIAVLNTSPNAQGAGIWQSGNGLASSKDGGVYAMTGNNDPSIAQSIIDRCGTVVSAAFQNGPCLGESFLRLEAKPDIGFGVSFARVGNYKRLDSGMPRTTDTSFTEHGDDADLGSGGPLILPDSGLVVGGGKQGSLYVIGRTPTFNFRQGFQAFFNSWHPEIDPCDYDAEQKNGPNIHGAPVWWKPEGSRVSWLYGMPEKEYLKAFRIDAHGRIEEHPGLSTVEIGERSPDGMPGGFLSISANGGKNGIVWASVGVQDAPDGSNQDIKGRLIAFDAQTLTKLWSDETDEVFTKFVPPTIGGGSVFRVVSRLDLRNGISPLSGRLIVYGIDPNNQSRARPRYLDLRPAVREITAAWRTPYHIDLFTSTLHAGNVISTSIGNPTGTPPEFAQCPKGWRGWFPIAYSAGTGLGNSSPVAAAWSPPSSGTAARLDLFTTNRAGGMVHATWQALAPGQTGPGRWHPDPHPVWSAVPGAPAVPAGTPITALWRNARHLDLFVAVGGSVQSTIFNQSGWGTWFSVRPETGKAFSNAPVTAVWRKTDRLDLFMSDTAGHVVRTYFENNQWQPNWLPLMPRTGSAKPGAPVTALWRKDYTRLDLFMTDVAGHVVRTYYDNNGWRPEWYPLDPAGLQALPGQRVSAVWRDKDRLDVFVVDRSGAVRQTYYDHAWQSHWASVGSVHANPGQPVTALWRTGGGVPHLDLFLTASNGAVMSTFWESKGGWRGWFAI